METVPVTRARNPRRLTGVRALAVAATVAVLAVWAPVVWMAAASGAGLLLLGGLIVLGLAAVRALPWLGQRLENTLLAARKAEAGRRPIEQLQNELLRRAQRLQAFRRALVAVGGQIESIGQMLVERRERDPAHVLERQEQALRRLQQFQQLNLARLGQAQAALDEFRGLVERKEAEWRIAVAIDEANELLDPNAGEHLMQDLLTDTALRTVQERFNQVFAELDVQMSGLDAPTRPWLGQDNLTRMGDLQLPTHPSNTGSST